MVSSPMDLNHKSLALLTGHQHSLASRGHVPEQSSDNQRQQTCRSAAEHLESLTTQLVAEVQGPNIRSSPLIRKHLSESYTMTNVEAHECPIVGASGREGCLDAIEQYLEKNGAFMPSVSHISVNVQKGSQRAVVFMTIRDRGFVNGKLLWREGVSVMHWERCAEDGWVWRLHRYVRILDSDEQD